jgi:NAD(P)-dependent dehydrogenase (short-subunit alcohol dehydrogenase family)
VTTIVGAAVARRFGSEGFDVALLSRSQGALACGLVAVRLRIRRDDGPSPA